MARTKGRRRLIGHGRALKDGLAACECGWAAVDKPRTTRSPWTHATADEARGKHLTDVRMEIGR